MKPVSKNMSGQAVDELGGEHNQTHQHGRRHGDVHDHPHHDHDHGHRHGHGHDHGHEHPGGLRGFLHGLFVPHSHDAADSVDEAMESSAKGIRALKISLAVLAVTSLLQLAVFLFSGSVALLADTIHNFSDA